MLLFAVTGNSGEPATECPNPPPECQSAISLSEYWRNVNAGTDVRTPEGLNCDTRDMNYNYPERPWFRFIGSAGNMMLNSCPPSASCGTHAGMWTDAAMPTAVGESIKISVFGSYNDHCKYRTLSILVMRCSYDTSYDFVYRYIDPYTSCMYSFCGMSYS